MAKISRFGSGVQMEKHIKQSALIAHNGGDYFVTKREMSSMKSGATQAAAGAVANELWKTASHATLPDNVVMIGV